jgi:hypothetical protein
VPDIRLESVDGQEHPALACQDLFQPAIIGQSDGQQFVVAVEQVADGPLGNVHATADEVARISGTDRCSV